MIPILPDILFLRVSANGEMRVRPPVRKLQPKKTGVFVSQGRITLKIYVKKAYFSPKNVFSRIPLNFRCISSCTVNTPCSDLGTPQHFKKPFGTPKGSNQGTPRSHIVSRNLQFDVQDTWEGRLESTGYFNIFVNIWCTKLSLL